VDILKQGGNAVDAAIAVQLALAVVYPDAGNIGGGGFMVASLANGKRIALDFREMAPGKASEDMYVNKATGKANLELSQTGRLASGVPGIVAGIFAAMKYAKLPFHTLIQPAIELAGHGFVITQREADNLNNTAKEFEQNNTSLPVLVKKNGKWKAGDTLIQTDLANTLKRIRDKGAKEFYEGKTAELIVQEMKLGNGIITLQDLKNYKVKERSACEFDYKGYHIITMPLPSSGGVLLEQMLKMLEHHPLQQYGFETVKSVQLITEVERRAYADRAHYLGDPDFIKVPVKSLVSDKYLQTRMADYDSTRAGKSEDIKAGVIKESEQTTHLSIIDKDGNCVSVTTTLNGLYGSKVFVAGAGFLLNNEMDDFSAQPGVPNLYGAIGGKANAIAPGKRMLSSMSPTIVLKNGRPFMVVGTPGGTTIITSVLQSIIDVVDYGMNAHDAVNKPKFHHQWLPDRIDIESGFPVSVSRRLESMGYQIKERQPWSRTELINVIGKNAFESTADKRGDDDAEGY
jgi:gamma-glutamyltranspeptidase / glutathione hydrolase